MSSQSTVDSINLRYISYASDPLSNVTVGGASPAGGFSIVLGKDITSFSGQYNTVIGYSAASTLTTGQNNVLIGTNANVANANVSFGVGVGYNSVTSSQSVVLGTGASSTNQQTVCVGASATSTLANVVCFGGGSSVVAARGTVFGASGSVTGTDGTAVGYQATVGSQGVAIGSGATASSTNALSIGYLARSANVGALNTTVIGSNAGNTSLSNNNVVIGYIAGTTTTGTSNTFIGTNSGLNNTSGSSNICIGNMSGTTGTTDGGVAIGATGNVSIGATVDGNYSIAMGFQTRARGAGEIYLAPLANGGTSPTGGTDNLYIGLQQAFAMSTGFDNLVIGSRSGEFLSTGQRNTVLGSGITALSTGSYNVLLFSGRNITTASNYVGIGSLSLDTITTGSVIGGVAIGPQALQSATNASDGCVALGFQAGVGITSGTFNTCIGSSSGGGIGLITTGSNNTCLGYLTAIPGGSNNCSAIGNGANNFTGDNQINLGNGAITQVRANVAVITFSSDERDKKDIEPLETGLNLVRELKPVQFLWNKRDGSKIDIPEIGFLAQDFLQAQKDTNTYIPNLVDDADPEHLTAAPSTLIPVFIRAMQENSTRLDKLDNYIQNINMKLGIVA